MSSLNIQSLIGLAGVADNECEKAQRIGHKFEIPMLLVAIWIVVEWYAELRGVFPEEYSRVTDIIIWLFFIIETTTLTLLVNNKVHYLRTNWINLLIIIIGVPIIGSMSVYAGVLRSLRLLLLLAILVNLSDTVRQVLARNNLGITLLVALVIIFMSGVLIAGIDPNIDSIWQGLWWAWVTVTTVGYGDVVPVSLPGKLFGSLLILLGVAIFSMLTASFSAFFVSRDKHLVKDIEKATLEKLDKIEKKLDALEQELANK